MYAWWHGLAWREQRLLLAATGVMLVAVLFLGLIEPMLKQRADLQEQLQRLVDEAAWLEAHAALVQAQAGQGGLTGSARPQGSASALAVVDASARRAGLGSALRRVRPDDQAVEAELEAAAYGSVMRWLAALETEHGLRIVSLSLDPAEESGRVNVLLRVVVNRAGAGA